MLSQYWLRKNGTRAPNPTPTMAIFRLVTVGKIVVSAA
jgi:hypothetical protein